jgi:D-alanyl-D-alanine carboxypeptidase (penicillin-binding protein 5/6)
MSKHPSILRLLALAAVLLAGLGAVPHPGAAFESRAREALLIDATTGAVLLEKEADRPMPPASMSKIMTVYLVFEALKDGRLSLDDKLMVSEKAWRMGGSKMFVEVGKQVRVEDLLRGVVVQSGNDACIVLAEGLAGSEEAFAELMNRKAVELGMHDSRFANSTGWPHPEQRMSPRDLATLALRTITDFPDYYHYYSETNFTFTKIKQGNRNPLLYKNLGADGLKTGHTDEAGYSLTGSAVQGGRRLIVVVSGLKSMKERGNEAQSLMNWGFREFDNHTLFTAGETVEEAPVWQGVAKTVPLVLAEDLTVTLPRKSRKKMTVSVRHDGPIPTPIEEGQDVATLVVAAPGAETVEVPLRAGVSVERLGLLGRFFSNVKHLVLGGS